MKEDLIEAELFRTSKNVSGRHVLGIQDTTELNFESHAGRTEGLGTVGNGTDAGIFLHPLLAVDAETGAGLGFGAIHVWNRLEKARRDYWNLPIEEKETFRWVSAAESSKVTLSQASLVTIIGDRESDIYELFTRIPDARTQVLNRVRSNRKLYEGVSLYEHIDSLPISGETSIKLSREIRQGRKARLAKMVVRHGEVTIQKPKKCRDKEAPKSLKLRVVDVREIDCPAGAEPIHWRLLTSHEVNTFEEAQQIINWYRCRWLIEQLFRTMKKQGLDIESTQVEQEASLTKLSIITLCAALKIMQLVQSRDGDTQQKVEEVFSEEEKDVLVGVLKKTEGKTEKQKNPFSSDSLAWAAWIIARLGGWKGYKSEAPPGPITMARGLEKFKSICHGWYLFKDVCIG